MIGRAETVEPLFDMAEQARGLLSEPAFNGPLGQQAAPPS